VGKRKYANNNRSGAALIFLSSFVSTSAPPQLFLAEVAVAGQFFGASAAAPLEIEHVALTVNAEFIAKSPAFRTAITIRIAIPVSIFLIMASATALNGHEPGSAVGRVIDGLKNRTRATVHLGRFLESKQFIGELRIGRAALKD